MKLNDTFDTIVNLKIILDFATTESGKMNG